jgi:hypothetical protein
MIGEMFYISQIMIENEKMFYKDQREEKIDQMINSTKKHQYSQIDVANLENISSTDKMIAFQRIRLIKFHIKKSLQSFYHVLNSFGNIILGCCESKASIIF